MPDSDDPMTAVVQYVDAFNNGDSAGMTATCADPMQILDGMWGCQINGGSDLGIC